MGLTVFNQFPQLTRLLARIARVAAKQETQWTFNRIDLSTGKATLKDRAMNQVTLTGGVVRLSMPEIEAGRAHDLVARVTCEAETEVVFDGAEFEMHRRAEGSEGTFGEAEPGGSAMRVREGGGELAAPSVGETIIYLFTETAPGVFLASRKVVEKIEEE